jgi:hypothetical protein
MEVIEGAAHPSDPVAREYGKIRQIWNAVAREMWFYRLRRWLPRLVWLGDELDVTITFTEDRLPEGTEQPFGYLFGGGLFEIEKRLRNMGIDFDTGMGFGGRDWEWDWSLKGPVNVKFRGRAKKPHLRARVDKPKPTLVSGGPPAA